MKGIARRSVKPLSEAFFTFLDRQREKEIVAVYIKKEKILSK